MLEPGQILSHYRLVEKIGEGGMGVVWRATDTTLDRDVAIKILPAEFAADPERLARFEREAKAVAGLNHPNIVTVHAVEQSGGSHFIAMELVRGRPLGELIPKRGLRLGKLFELAVALTDAIGAAHEQGITHRDLKPENVMVGDDGRLKVLDFGLAKLHEETRTAEGTHLPTASVTQEGKILGTVAYMAPEQAEGKPVDHRSDIFSLGVMLYQMATGHRPFRGDTSISVISSIMKDTPPPITDLRPGLPRHLGRIVKHCLAKDPGKRYQSTLDLRNELAELCDEVASGETVAPSTTAAALRGGKPGWRGALARRAPWPTLLLAATAVVIVGAVAARFWLQGSEETPAPQGTASIPTVAVMGFENLSDPEDADRLGRVLMGLVTTDLVESRGLDVVSTARVLAAIRETGGTVERGFDLAVAVEAAGLAGAEVMLVGQVNRDGEKVVLAAELVEVRSGRTTGSIRQEASTFSELFALADSIAAEVRRQLGVSEPSAEEGAFDLAQSLTGSAEAYRQYAAGEVAFHLAHFDDAIRAFRAAIDLDPQFALAYYRLGMVQGWAGQPAQEALSNGLPFIDRLPEHWQTLYRAYIDFQAGRWVEAREALEPLAALDVPIPDLYYVLSEVATHSSRYWDPRVIRDYSERTLELDPTFSTAWFHLSQMYRLADDRDALRDAAERAGKLGSSEEALAVRLSLEVAERRFADAEQTFAALGRGRRHGYWLALDPLLQLGKAETFIESLESLLGAEGVDQGTVLHALGLARAWLGRFEQATGDLSVAATYPGPDRQRCARLLGVARLRRLTGDLDEALRSVAAAIELDGDEASSRYWEGRIHLDGGAIAEAESALNDARELAARVDSPLAGFWADMLAAEVQFARGDIAGARRTLARIASLPTEYRERPVETRLRARVLEAGGDRPGAITAYREVLDPPWLLAGEHANPWIGWPLHGVEVLYDLARLEQAAGDLDQAREHYRAYVGHWGDADREVRGMAAAREQFRRLARDRSRGPGHAEERGR